MPSGLERPNVLLIVTTQWRGQALGFAGDPNARTPHLDAFAAEATRFEQAFTPHPFGPFARAALLTGVASPENGVRDYYDPLPRSRRTLAHAYNDRGYATAFFGKWHLARRDPAAPLVGEAHARTIVPPEDRGGFSHWDGFESGYLLNDPWFHGTSFPQPRQLRGYQSDVVVDLAREWIAAAREPWFCLVSLEAPHPPYSAPVPAADVAGPVRPMAARETAGTAGGSGGPGHNLVLPANVPRGGAIESRARRELAGYHAHIHATDRSIGRLIASASASGSTRIVFTSVHGDMHGAHGLFRKGWPYEESIRVPLLWRETGPGSSIRTPVSLLDVARCLLSEPTAATPSLPVLARAQPARSVWLSMPSVVRLPDQCDRAWRAVRTDRHKLVVAEDGSPWLFFDLGADPGEEHNLAPAQAGGPSPEFTRLLHLLRT